MLYTVAIVFVIVTLLVWPT